MLSHRASEGKDSHSGKKRRGRANKRGTIQRFILELDEMSELKEPNRTETDRGINAWLNFLRKQSFIDIPLTRTSSQPETRPQRHFGNRQPRAQRVSFSGNEDSDEPKDMGSADTTDQTIHPHEKSFSESKWQCPQLIRQPCLNTKTPALTAERLKTVRGCQW